MTITIQENTDISLKNDIKKITQIQNVTASLSGQDSNKKAKNKELKPFITNSPNKNTLPTLSRKHQLYELIVDSRGRPDALAINLYWDEFRSWYSSKKQSKGGNVVDFSKLHSKGIHVCYRFLADRYKVSEDTIRRKIVILEKLGLISRDFEQNINYGKVLFNQLVIYVWQQTNYFYNPIGIDRAKVGELKPSTNHKYISSKYNASHINVDKDRGYMQDSGLHDTSTHIGICTDKYTKTLRPLLKEITPSYAKGVISVSSILKEETNTRACDPVQQKPATFAPCSLNGAEQVAPLGMKESVTATIANQRNKLQEVQQALRSILGERKAEEIRVHCEIIELEPDKVGIYTGALPINDIDKVKIRQALKSVYGNNVQITKIDTRPSEQHEQEEISKDIPPNILPQYDWSKKATWKDFRISIINNSKNPFSLTAIFNMPMLKVTEELGRVIIESEPNLIDQLSSPIWYLEDMERAVLETGLTLELKVDNNHSECKDIPQKVVVLAPEEIIEKIKLAWSKKQEEQKNYEIFKSRYGNVIQNAKT